MPYSDLSARADQPVIGDDARVENDVQLLVSDARVASRRRALTVGELVEDMADRLCAGGRADGGAGFALPFVQALVAGRADSRRRIHVACDPALRLAAQQLAAVGMIVSEGVSNALEHGFPPGRDGDIWVRLSQADGRVTLRIRDNGIGMPDLDHAPNTGRGLIEALGDHLRGFARLGSVPFGGAEVSVTFPQSA
jgi:signal transduction histidine kinase